MAGVTWKPKAIVCLLDGKTVAIATDVPDGVLQYTLEMLMTGARVGVGVTTNKQPAETLAATLSASMASRIKTPQEWEDFWTANNATCSVELHEGGAIGGWAGKAQPEQCSTRAVVDPAEDAATAPAPAERQAQSKALCTSKPAAFVNPAGQVTPSGNDKPAAARDPATAAPPPGAGKPAVALNSSRQHGQSRIAKRKLDSLQPAPAPLATTMDDPVSTSMDDPVDAPKDDPVSALMNDPMDAPMDDPANTPMDNPNQGAIASCTLAMPSSSLDQHEKPRREVPRRACKYKLAAAAPPPARPPAGQKRKDEPKVERQKQKPKATCAASPPPSKVLRMRAGHAEEPPCVVLPREGEVMVHEPGREPWRVWWGLQVNEQPIVTAAACQMVKECKAEFDRMRRRAILLEEERCKDGVHKDGKRMSKRPDVVARKMMLEAGKCVNTSKTIGHVPGININDMFYLRAEMAACGIHFPPIGGIDCMTSENLHRLGKKRCPPFAVSVVNSGIYKDDQDNEQEIIYTGQGGIDLLGNKAQTADQDLKFGNKALVGNIALGVPVRVLRQNDDDSEQHFDKVYIYDGLYRVQEYWSTRSADGPRIYQFKLVRLPGQGLQLSKRVITAAPRKAPCKGGFDPGLVCADISRGLEPVPVPAYNTVDEELPPCITLDDVPPHCAGRAGLEGRKPSVRYVIENEHDPRVPRPATRKVPPEFRGKPHEFVKRLNRGQLPYVNEDKKGKVPLLLEAQPLVYECGEWTGCKQGKHCSQAVTQQDIKWRFQLVKTASKGWGVLCRDMIPNGAFVMKMVGQVVPFAGIGKDDPSFDHSYVYDMEKRADMDLDGNLLTHEQIEAQDDPRYVLDTQHVGSLARFLNHSCDPNLFCQPVIVGHADVDQPAIAFFAMANIPPFTELTYDYGENQAFACGCGAPICSRPAEGPQGAAGPGSQSPGKCKPAHASPCGKAPMSSTYTANR